MPQSLSVFAVSLQEHPELLMIIIHLLRRNVNTYFCPNKNTFAQRQSLVEPPPASRHVGTKITRPPAKRGKFPVVGIGLT
jgi:hypothetical protein